MNTTEYEEKTWLQIYSNAFNQSLSKSTAINLKDGDKQTWIKCAQDEGLKAVVAHARATDEAYTQDLICTLRCERDEALEVKKQLVEALQIADEALASCRYFSGNHSSKDTWHFREDDVEKAKPIIAAALRAVEEKL